MPQGLDQITGRLDGINESLADLHRQAQIERDRETERYRGLKWMRLPQLVTGKMTGAGPTTIGQLGQVGPEQGYMWSLRRLVVTGLTAGATPDIVNLFFNDGATQIEWQFNGNNFGYTFGRFELCMRPGDIALLQNGNTIVSTANIVLSGELMEVPAEIVGRLL
jgi:hypothetical protein